MRLETRLHRARVARGIDLTDLAVRTHLSPQVVKKIDEGRFAELPPGIYARSYVKAFASAVGVEPAEAVRELEDVLPPVEDPLDGLRDAVRQSNAVPGALRMRAAKSVAAVLDAAVLLALNAAFIRVIAATCEVEAAILLNQAGAAVSMFCAIPVALYFIVFGGLGGQTPGAWLCKLPPSQADTPLSLRTILMRAVRC